MLASVNTKTDGLDKEMNANKEYTLCQTAETIWFAKVMWDAWLTQTASHWITHDHTHLQQSQCAHRYFVVRQWCFLYDNGIEPSAVSYSGLIRASRLLEWYKCAESNGTERKLGLHWWPRITVWWKEGRKMSETIRQDRQSIYRAGSLQLKHSFLLSSPLLNVHLV